MFDNYKELASYIRKFSEFELMDSVLAESISSQLGTGIIVKSFPFWKVQMPAVYDMSHNQIIVNEKRIPNITALLKSVNILYKEKDRFTSIFKDTLGPVIGGICYYGTHLYNMNNRGALIKEDLTKSWYKKFFSKSLYKFSNLSTLTDKTVDMFVIPYLNIIVTYFELRSYSGMDYTSKQESKLDFMMDNFGDKIKDNLKKWAFDKPALDEYSDWFKLFMSDFKLFFRNRTSILVKLDDEFMNTQVDDDFKSTINVVDHKMLYSTYDALPKSKVEYDRYPSPPFRELFVTAEPMAQWVNTLVRQNKLKQSDEMFQLIASRGISYLGSK